MTYGSSKQASYDLKFIGLKPDLTKILTHLKISDFAQLIAHQNEHDIYLKPLEPKQFLSLKTLLPQFFKEKISFILLAQNFKPQAFFFDMDSTVIEQESLVELAVLHGSGSIVAEITKRAMRGEMAFAESLIKRVATLKGMRADLVAQAAEDVRIFPYAETWVEKLKSKGVPSFLISGGFREFGAKVLERVLFLSSELNQFEIENGLLTGRVLGHIVDAERKAEFLIEQCRKHQFDPKRCVAVGDGANDLAMMETSGLSVGFNPKEVLWPHLSGANFTNSYEWFLKVWDTVS